MRIIINNDSKYDKFISWVQQSGLSYVEFDTVYKDSTINRFMYDVFVIARPELSHGSRNVCHDILVQSEDAKVLIKLHFDLVYNNDNIDNKDSVHSLFPIFVIKDADDE